MCWCDVTRIALCVCVESSHFSGWPTTTTAVVCSKRHSNWRKLSRLSAGLTDRSLSLFSQHTHTHNRARTYTVLSLSLFFLRTYSFFLWFVFAPPPIDLLVNSLFSFSFTRFSLTGFVSLSLSLSTCSMQKVQGCRRLERWFVSICFKLESTSIQEWSLLLQVSLFYLLGGFQKGKASCLSSSPSFPPSSPSPLFPIEKLSISPLSLSLSLFESEKERR